MDLINNHKENLIVAVWMVTYNHELYIEQAIESVMMQVSDFEFKLFIGEDCSTDRTREICLKLKDKYGDKIELILHESNVGPNKNALTVYNACFNSGAKYVAMLEGDDYWMNNYKLKKQVDFLEQNEEYSGCFHNVIMRNEMNTDSTPKPWRNYAKDSFKLIDTFSKLALLHTSSFVFRRVFFELPLWYANAKSGDMVLFSIIASKGMLKLLPGESSVYRKNEKGVTSKIKIIQHHKDRIKLMQLFKKNFNVHSQHLQQIINYHRKQVLVGYIKNIINTLKLRLNEIFR